MARRRRSDFLQNFLAFVAFFWILCIIVEVFVTSGIEVENTNLYRQIHDAPQRQAAAFFPPRRHPDHAGLLPPEPANIHYEPLRNKSSKYKVVEPPPHMDKDTVQDKNDESGPPEREPMVFEGHLVAHPREQHNEGNIRRDRFQQANQRYQNQEAVENRHEEVTSQHTTGRRKIYFRPAKYTNEPGKVLAQS